MVTVKLVSIFFGRLLHHHLPADNVLRTVIISSKVAQYLSLISDYSAYQTMPESGCAATVYLCQHELGVGQINVCREAFLKKCAGEEKCPIQPQHYYPP